MKNNKGFTLIELLVVVVILISISAIALPNVITTLNKNKKQEIKNQSDLLISYMEIYDSKDINASIFSRMNNCNYFSVQKIIEFLNLDEDKFDKIKNGKIIYSNYLYVYEENTELTKECSLN